MTNKDFYIYIFKAFFLQKCWGKSENQILWRFIVTETAFMNIGF
jgi:hypothetical protein